jgi:hypothetical protein
MGKTEDLLGLFRWELVGLGSSSGLITQSSKVDPSSPLATTGRFSLGHGQYAGVFPASNWVTLEIELTTANAVRTTPNVGPREVSSVHTNTQGSPSAFSRTLDLKGKSACP